MDNYIYYTTKEGDTFDIIALNLYNNSFKAHIIMQANPQYVSIIKFSGGIQLRAPIIEEDPASTLPPWKR